MLPVLLGLIFISAAAAQLPSISSCCRYTENITVQNSGNEQVTDGRSSRAATFFCALDSGEVTNIDFGFLEQVPGSKKFTLSIYLRAPVKNSLIEEVWSANRDALVGINSTLAFVVGQGLRLFDEGSRLVWSVNVSAAGFMLDCSVGNLILFDSGNRTLWQSFDHPTDTQMQGQVLKYKMKLVSRKSVLDPSSGSYTMAVEASGLALYDEFQQPYWWNSTGSDSVTASSCPGQEAFTSSSIFNVGELEVDTCNRSSSRSFVFRSYPNSLNKTRFMRLDELGRLQVYDWNLGSKVLDYDFLENDCALPDFCGKFGVCENNGQCSCPDNFRRNDASDPTRGCALPAGEEQLTCTNSSFQGNREMVPVSGLSSTVVQYSYDNSRNFASAGDCSLSCLNNCSCRAAIYISNTSQCYTYQNESRIQSFTKAGGSAGFIKLGELSSKASSKAGVIAGVTVSLVVLLIPGLVFLWHWKIRSAPAEDVEEDEEAFLDSLPGLPPRFTVKALEEATNGFSHKLGQGGFGEVYLGRLNGLQVAVKRLASAHQGKKEFRAEVATIGNIHHVNLVRLRGFCATGSHRLLVYEYMVNASLDRWLFKTESEESLDWSTRFNIALGTARGLTYLHESCKERILHLDIKPQNILLDEKFVAKVSDFGLAKLMGGEETHVFTTMRGTPGYLAPEWLTSAISEKSDVYSFGVVLLELVSGKHSFQKPAAGDGDSQSVVLSLWASAKVDQGRGVEVVEERVRRSLDAEQEKQVETVVSTAIWCVQTDPGMRPSMNTVVLVLEGLVKSEKPPALGFDLESSSRVSDELLQFINSSISSTSGGSSSVKQTSSSQLSSR